MSRRYTEILEVRCCRQPKKLLGWMEVPKGASEISLAYYKPPSEMTLDKSGSFFLDEAETGILTLPIEIINIGGERYRAVKAEGHTEEDLIKFKNFVPKTYRRRIVGR